MQCMAVFVHAVMNRAIMDEDLGIFYMLHE